MRHLTPCSGLEKRVALRCPERGAARCSARDDSGCWKFELMQAIRALSLFDSCDVRRMQEAPSGRHMSLEQQH